MEALVFKGKRIHFPYTQKEKRLSRKRVNKFMRNRSTG